MQVERLSGSYKWFGLLKKALWELEGCRWRWWDAGYSSWVLVWGTACESCSVMQVRCAAVSLSAGFFR